MYSRARQLHISLWSMQHEGTSLCKQMIHSIHLDVPRCRGICCCLVCVCCCCLSLSFFLAFSLSLLFYVAGYCCAVLLRWLFCVAACSCLLMVLMVVVGCYRFLLTVTVSRPMLFKITGQDLTPRQED